MSRSWKKEPISGLSCADSEKKDKQQYNRRYRSHIKRAIRDGDEELKNRREFSNPWDMAKDGKTYRNDPRAFRK